MTTMSRRQLYDLIWSKPMRDAAAGIGISDVGLKKVCVRYRVPVPPQGYWNKVHAGQSLPKAIFRDVDSPEINRVVITGSSYNPPAAAKKTLLEARARERAVDRKVSVNSAEPPSQPAAIALAAMLKKAKPDKEGLVEARDPKVLHVKVAPQSVDRAVAIVEALLRAAVDRGFTARAGDKDLELVANEETVELRLTEEVRWIPRPQTQAEIAKEERRRQSAQTQYGELFSLIYRPEPRLGDYRAQGLLTIEVVNKEHGVRSRWRDTRTLKLELLLNRLLADLAIFAVARKERRAEQKRREREWLLREQHQADARARAELEKARLEFLEQRLEAFDEMNRLDRFLSRLSSSTHWQEPLPRLKEFIQWAERRVQQLKRQCSADALQEALVDSTLFGPNPKPPTAYPWN